MEAAVEVAEVTAGGKGVEAGTCGVGFRAGLLERWGEVDPNTAGGPFLRRPAGKTSGDKELN